MASINCLGLSDTEIEDARERDHLPLFRPHKTGVNHCSDLSDKGSWYCSRCRVPAPEEVTLSFLKSAETGFARDLSSEQTPRKTTPRTCCFYMYHDVHGTAHVRPEFLHREFLRNRRHWTRVALSRRDRLKVYTLGSCSPYRDDFGTSKPTFTKSNACHRHIGGVSGR